MLLSGGRTLRVPLGWVFVAAALLVGLCWLAYEGGFRRGSSSEREKRIVAQGPIVGPEQDPLNARPAAPKPIEAQSKPPAAGTLPGSPSGGNQPAAAGKPGGTAKPQTGGPTKPLPSPGASSATQAAPTQTAPQPFVTGADPRTAGMNYFVLARLPQDEAEKAAAYLSKNGVAAAVVPSDNPKFQHVITTRGFVGSDLNGPEASRLKSEIRRIGRAFKAETKGPTDFADLYPRKHTP